jgi:hypothetical protein
LKEKLVMLTEASDDTAEQKKDLEIEITRLESETLEERNQRKEEEDRKKEEAATVAKAERDRNCAEKEAGEAQRVERAAAKASERDAKWTAEVDESIKSMINGGVSYPKIASKLGNGLTETDIVNRWHRKLKKSSGIIKPAVPGGFPSSFTWTADVDATIVRMRTDGDSFAKIASELGNGLARHDIMNRWNRHLKDKLQKNGRRGP